MRRYTNLHTYDAERSKVANVYESMLAEEQQRVTNKKLLEEKKLNEAKGISISDTNFSENLGLVFESILADNTPDEFWDDGRYIFDVQLVGGAKPGFTTLEFIVFTINEMDDPSSQIDVPVKIDLSKGAKVGKVK